MTNREIARFVRELRKCRDEWMVVLVKTDSVEAAQHVLSINTKIEFVLSLWNWSDESTEYPHI